MHSWDDQLNLAKKERKWNIFYSHLNVMLGLYMDRSKNSDSEVEEHIKELRRLIL